MEGSWHKTKNSLDGPSELCHLLVEGHMRTFKLWHAKKFFDLSPSVSQLPTPLPISSCFIHRISGSRELTGGSGSRSHLPSSGDMFGFGLGFILMLFGRGVRVQVRVRAGGARVSLQGVQVWISGEGGYGFRGFLVI